MRLLPATVVLLLSFFVTGCEAGEDALDTRIDRCVSHNKTVLKRESDSVEIKPDALRKGCEALERDGRLPEDGEAEVFDRIR